MGVIGSSGGGYATVNPTQGNPMGDALANIENSAFKYRAEKREEDQLEASRQKLISDAKEKDLKDQQAYADKHKISKTSISSVNSAILDFTLENKNMYNNATNTYKTSNNEDERKAALETMTNLESSFEVSKALPEMLNAYAKDLEDGVRMGKYNPRSSTNAAETIDAMNKGNMKVVFKSNGIATFITYKRDAQGNLTQVIDKEITLDQLKQKLTPILAFDGATNDIEFRKTLGDRIETEKGNNVIKGYPNLSASAEQNANSIVTNRDKMYGIAPEAGITPKTNLEDYTPEEIQKVKEHVKQGLESKYKDSITTNDSKLNREQTAANQARLQSNSDREYNRQVAKDADEKSQDTSWGQVYTVKQGDANRNSGIKVNIGDKVIQVISEGKKDKTGASQVTRAVAIHKNGESISVSIDKNVGTDPMTFEPKIKQVTYNTKTNMGGVERALIGLKTEDGETISDLNQAKSFIKKYAGVTNKITPKPAPKTPSTKPVVKETPKQTQAQWNASWAKLKKGQKLVGLDGNTYTKN